MNAAFREAANGAQKGVLAVVDEPLVSVDFRMTDVSTSIDASLTMVMGDDLVRALASRRARSCNSLWRTHRMPN